MFITICVYSLGNILEEAGEKISRTKIPGNLLLKSLSYKWLHKQNQNNGYISGDVNMEGRDFIGVEAE